MKFMVIIFAIFFTVSAKRCVEYGVNYLGYHLDSVDNVQHWADCANHCKNHRGCQYWSWQLGNWQGHRKRCWLKSTIDGRTIEPVTISGKFDCTTEC